MGEDHMARPLLVFEDLDKTNYKKLFRLFGIDWYMTSIGWLCLPLFYAAGVLIAYFYHTGEPVGALLFNGLIYGLLLILINTFHTIGHIFSGRITRAPMTSVIVTATRQLNWYDEDPNSVGKGVHIMRSLGGPLMNILTGLIAYGIDRLIPNMALSFFASTTILIGIVALLPIPSVDGWVIWGEITGLRKR
jgi:hypothetical protein